MKVFEEIFFDIYSESSFNTLYIEIKHKCFKKNSFGQNKRYKNALFFLSRAPTHHSFTFNSQFLYELRHQAHPSKSMYGIFHFQFRLAFIKGYVFGQQKA